MKFLKNIVLVFIITGLIIPAEALIQLSHIPALILHFQHHNREHEHIHFTDFLALHFSGGDNHDSDEEHSHDQLPFTHHHSTNCFQTLTFADLSHFPSLQVIPHSKELKKIPLYEDFFLSEYAPSIWQPPKLS